VLAPRFFCYLRLMLVAEKLPPVRVFETVALAVTEESRNYE
jgi:hypothetical protein